MAASNVRQFPLGGRAGARAGMLTINVPFEGNAVDRYVWVCPAGMKYRLHSVQEIHSVKTGTATAHTVIPSRCATTEAPASGDLLATGINLLADAAVIQTGTLQANTVNGTFDFSAGHAMGLKFAATGTPDSLAGAVLTLVLIPISDVRHQVIP